MNLALQNNAYKQTVSESNKQFSSMQSDYITLNTSKPLPPNLALQCKTYRQTVSKYQEQFSSMQSKMELMRMQAKQKAGLPGSTACVSQGGGKLGGGVAGAQSEHLFFNS